MIEETRVAGLGKPKLTNSVVLDFFYHLTIQAYSNYDEEVGYCQGLSFMTATFLLHVSFNTFLMDYFSSSCKSLSDTAL